MELKGKTINFCGKEYLVVDEFKYEFYDYLYLINTDAEEKQKVELVYIKKITDDEYEAVTNQEEIDKLMLVESNRMLKEKFKKSNG